jgi:hypothetical protein
MPPTFRAAVLGFGQGKLAAASDQLASLFPNMLARMAAVRTGRMLGHMPRVMGQFLDPKLASHLVANTNHGGFNVLMFSWRLPKSSAASSASTSATNSLIRSSIRLLLAILGSFT